MSEAASQAYEPRLKTHYRDVLSPQLSKTFEYTNPMQAPRLSKIVLNMGVGQAAGDSKKIRTALEGLSAIAGQKAVPTRARKSIAGFKLREGMEIGAKATLRRDRMYEFLDRLVNVALPRMKDFRGLLRRSFDGNGNYALGIREHIVFPEIDYDSVDQMWGLDVVLCTSVRNDDEAVALLEGLGLPFRN